MGQFNQGKYQNQPLATSSAPAGSGLEFHRGGSKEVSAWLPSKLLPVLSFYKQNETKGSRGKGLVQGH